ncbi:hypothetical protein C0584_05070 [Candidatus Parcubacteria bacterium]|nr:MAG: hypothetical protein C0584_05070 [Candidatus Parcubacteria bacterium]
MFNIIPLIIILISLSIIITIVVRKFSALANLDVDNMPAEKEARFKERLVTERLKRSFLKWNFRIRKNLGPVMQVTGKTFSYIYEKLNEVKEKHAPVKTLDQEGKDKKLNDLYLEVDNNIKEKDFAAAEKALIEIIGIDTKDVRAFKTLANLYFEKRSFEEALQTYEHVLKLLEDTGDKDENTTEKQSESARVYFEMALISKEMGDLDIAKDNVVNALGIDSKNPRFLDTLVEISIMRKDKNEAQSALEKLKRVNPENQKLSEIQEKIESL